MVVALPVPAPGRTVAAPRGCGHDREGLECASLSVPGADGAAADLSDQCSGKWFIDQAASPRAEAPAPGITNRDGQQRTWLVRGRRCCSRSRLTAGAGGAAQSQRAVARLGHWTGSTSRSGAARCSGSSAPMGRQAGNRILTFLRIISGMAGGADVGVDVGSWCLFQDLQVSPRQFTKPCDEDAVTARWQAVGRLADDELVIRDDPTVGGENQELESDRGHRVVIRIDHFPLNLHRVVMGHRWPGPAEAVLS